MTSRHTYRAGFTLVEMLVVITISTLVMTSLTSMLIVFYRSNAAVLEQTQAIHNSRHAMDIMTIGLRNALYSSDRSTAIIAAATSSLSLYTDTNNDGVLETNTYTLAAGTLTETVLVNDEVVSSRILADGAVNDASTPLFSYIDQQGAELSYPIALSKIAAVSLQLHIDVDSNRTPGPFSLQGFAVLRNAKSRL